MQHDTGIVIPCFNESRRFPKEYWYQVFQELSDVKWILVDDGSTDSTIDLLEQFSIFPNVSVLRLERNLGKGNAIRAGLLQLIKLKLRTIGYIDSDGAFSISDISKLTELALTRTEYDSVVSSRVALAGRLISRNPFRHYVGRIIATLLTFDWKGSPYDTQSGFKLFWNTKYLVESIQKPFQTRWFVDIELFSRISLAKGDVLQIWEEPMSEWHDVTGSKLSMKNAFLILKEYFLVRTYIKNMLKVRG